MSPGLSNKFCSLIIHAEILTMYLNAVQFISEKFLAVNQNIFYIIENKIYCINFHKKKI